MSKLDAIPMTTQPLWGSRERLLHWRRNNATLFSGSLIMLLGTGMVSVINFGYNVVVAQMLGPAAFGEVSAAVTLFMLVSAATLSFQLVCAKFVARNATMGGKAAVYSSLMRRAWLAGIGLAALLVLSSGAVSGYLHLPTRWIVIALSFGIAFYIPLGVRRGAMQGTCTFPRLSFNYVLETLVRFAAAVALIFLVTRDGALRSAVTRLVGGGDNPPVVGAVLAISLAIIAAFFLPRISRELRSKPGQCIAANYREGMQAIIFFVGQVIINNIDILLVKHYFAAREAGLYAAVALVGRVLYFASWSIVSAMFPISAAAGAAPDATRQSRGVLSFALFAVFAISAGFILFLKLFAPAILGLVFGSGFREAEPLLSLYAIATAGYALSVVLIAYEMSRRIANTGWLQLLFSGLVIVGISAFHDSLRQVIVVQIVLMGILLAVVSLPFLRRLSRQVPVEEAA